MDDYSGIPYTKYIHSLDEDAATVVGGWRLRAQELVPDVKEGESYGMPALRYRALRTSGGGEARRVSSGG